MRKTIEGRKRVGGQLRGDRREDRERLGNRNSDGEPLQKEAKDQKVQRKWRMLLISNSLFGGLTWDPWFVS